MSDGTFLSELKRRRVARVAVVYGATAFAVLQAAELMVPRLRLPDWTVTFVLLLALLGLPIALVLAWAFELTPEGVRRTEAAPAANEERTPDKQKWISPRTVLAAAALVLIGLAAGWVIRPARQDTTSLDSMPSLAVLPLENVGGDDAHAPFAIGLHDDLLTQLSRIDGLRLVSRTSVREYANTSKNIKQIAAELGVDNILEGSVQRSEQQVRINVQLIDAASDRHLWAQTYDEDLTVANLFAIQAEIAGAIARALRAELAGETRAEIARAPTTNLAAYESYLRGLAAGYWDYETVAADAFSEATRLDPSFAVAFAGEARARAWLARTAYNRADVESARALGQQAQAAAARAAALAPDAPESKLALGYVAYYVDWNLTEALAQFRGVEAVRANDAEVAIAIGLILRRLGRWDDALAEFQRAMALDERNEGGAQEYAQTAVYLGRYDDGVRYARLALELRPGEPDALEALMRAYAGAGDTLGLRQLLERTSPRFEADVVDAWLFVPLARDAMQKRLVAVLENRDDQPPVMVYWAAMRWAKLLGRTDVQRMYADSLLARSLPALRALEATGDARVRSNQHFLTALGFAYRGELAQANTHARRATELVPYELDAVEAWHARGVLLEVLVVTEQLDEAIIAARELVRRPGPYSMARLDINPLLQPLRQHPEYRALPENAAR